MNNQEILRKIVNYIENVMKEKSLTSRDLADICVKKTGKMSPRTIDNMFKTPSSTTLSTLLKVCDGLDLNLNSVFHSDVYKRQILNSVFFCNTGFLVSSSCLMIFSFASNSSSRSTLHVCGWFGLFSVIRTVKSSTGV